jgi:lipopolysaccharide export system permease protein
MPVFSKYLYKEFFKYLLFSLFAFITIYIMVHFFGKVDNFIEADVPKGVIIQYLVYLLPFIVVQMLPPSVLIAAIIMFSLMRKNNEIIALKACGVKLFDFLYPVFLLGFVLSLGLFVFSETVVPYTSSRANGLWRVYVEKKSAEGTYGRDHIWYKSKNGIYWIARFDSRKMIMYRPTFYFFDASFDLMKRIDGKTAVWRGGSWEVHDGITLTKDREGGYALSRFKKISLKVPEKPETFSHQERQPEEMGYWQLKRFAEKVKNEGYDAGRYFVDLNIKVSFPFIVFIMVLLGTPIALLQNRGGTPVAVAAGVVACFCYLVVLGLARSLGLAGMLPPFLAAWLANGIFFFLGSSLILKLDQ